jgi:alpha-galactosidase
MMVQVLARRCAANLFFLVVFERALAGMALAQQKVPIAATPPMGWNSWNHFGEKVSAEVVRAQADALVKNGMKAAGYVYVNIDDGWAGQRDAKGIIHPNAKFPDMKRLADYIHGLGLKFGIYTAASAKTCVGLEGSLGYEEQDAETYAEWGVDYVKVDWCEEGYDWFNGDDREARARFAKMGEALRRAGRPMVYSVSAPGPGWRWAASLGAHLWRTSIDIKDNWDRMANNGFGEDGLERFAAPGHWNDPDMLEVGNNGRDNTVADATLVQAPIYRKGMSEEEYRTHMSLWCLLAAPLIVGADLSHLKPSDLSILTNPEVVAVDQDPLGIQGRRVAKEGPLEVWMRPLAGGSRAVGLFNRELGTMALTAYFREIGVGENARVRDLWAGKDLGGFHEKYTANVPGHGVVLIQVK